MITGTPLGDIARLTAAIAANRDAADNIAAVRRKAIRRARLDGYTVRQIAAAAGIDPARISRIAGEETT